MGLHPDHVRSFERARPNQLWQTDLFTFLLKRQNRRVYLVAFLDDHSRYLVARPRHPQTLGKIERFWGTLWRECLEAAVFVDLADARTRIGHFIDHYNFQRVQGGIDGLVPADRFFGAAPDVLRTLKERVAANAFELARDGVPKEPFYLTGQVGGRNFSLHAEGERVFLTREGGGRQEVDLVPPPADPAPAELPPAVCPDGSPRSAGMPAVTDDQTVPAPGTSPLDEWLSRPGRSEESPPAGSGLDDLGTEDTNAPGNGGAP